MRFLLFLLLIWGCRATAMTDTSVVRHQKGVLFLSYYNDDYDYSGAEVKSVGFFDFFYPDSNKIKTYELRSKDNISFRNGLRVGPFSERNNLKKLATEIECSDTSNCYLYQKCYLVPVIISYKVTEDYWPFLCRRNYYELKLGNSGMIRFEYKHELITVIEIKVDRTSRVSSH